MTSLGREQGEGQAPDWLLTTAWLVVPLGALVYQIAAKVIAEATRGRAVGLGWVRAALTQPVTALLIVSELAGLAAWMVVLSRMSLSAAFPLSAISYVLVIGAGWTLFHEPMSSLQAGGGALILAGVWLLGRRPRHA